MDRSVAKHVWDCYQDLVLRTQTGEESLKESLLSVITASDNATLEVLDEAFCRDAEAFSEAFQVHKEDYSDYDDNDSEMVKFFTASQSDLVKTTWRLIPMLTISTAAFDDDDHEIWQHNEKIMTT